MVAISFSEKRFVELIQQGIKDQTIRPYNPKRFGLIKRKKKLQLYYKQRTKECFKIADAELIEIFKIRFKNLIEIWNEEKQEWTQAKTKDIEEIIKRDGFESGWELYSTLYSMYGEKMHDMEFIVIRFKLKEG